MRAVPSLLAVFYRHLAFEDAGIIEPLLPELGYKLVYRDVGVDALPIAEDSAADLLVILGGPIGAGDDVQHPYLLDELRVISARLEQSRPTIGVCLGAQLMALALGGTVEPGGHKEIGFAPIDITSEGVNSALRFLGNTPVLHWHGDNISFSSEVRSLSSISVLATTALCPVQAFAVGSHALGIQCHVEAEPTRINQWIIGHAHELASTGIEPEEIRAAAQQHGDELRAAGQKAITEWLARAR